MLNTILSGFQKSYLNEIEKQQDFLNIKGIIYIEENTSINFNIDFAFERDKLRSNRVFKMDDIAYDDMIVTNSAPYLLNALTLFDRFDIFSNIHTSERLDIIYKHITFWIKKLQKLDINLVITREIPHFPAEYCLYIATRILNIEIIMFDNAEHFQQTLCMKSIEDRIVKSNKQESVEQSKELIKKLRKSHSEVKKASNAPSFGSFYNKWSPVAWFKYISRDILSVLKYGVILQSPISILLSRKDFIKRKKPSHLRVRWFFFLLRLKVFSLDSFYRSITKKFNYNTMIKDKSIVFFANYQPERTTNPDGGSFVDMYNAVKMIKDGLPKDWTLYYKEHPNTFSPPYTDLLRGVLFRNKNFYRKLQNIGVELVPISFDSFKLLDNASVACSINGTILLEAVANKKRSIILGNCWIEGLEGVRKITSSSELNDFIESEDIYKPIDEDKLSITMSSIYDEGVEYLNLLNNIRSKKSVEYEVSVLMTLIKRNIDGL